MTTKKFFNTYFNQHSIAFNSGAIGGLMRGGNDIERFKQLQSDGPPSKKAFKLLIAAPAAGDSSPRMNDVSHVYRAFKRAGYDVDFTTADGRPMTFRQSDLTDPVNRWFAEDAVAQHKAYHSLSVEDVLPGRYAAIYFAGSDESVTENRLYRQLVDLIFNNNGVVAGSGGAEHAITAFELSDKIDNRYSLPGSDAIASLSDYGSAAVKTVKADTAWMIHKNKLMMPEEGEPESIGERIVQQLAK